MGADRRIQESGQCRWRRGLVLKGLRGIAAQPQPVATQVVKWRCIHSFVAKDRLTFRLTDEPGRRAAKNSLRRRRQLLLVISS